MFNTSFYKVKVSRISFDTDSGTLSGLLYMPKGVDASNPHPTIVTTHGYLNSAEMQDETAIEMSRRGYVVLALDMYDHGHSHGNADNTGGFFNFWPTSLWDAAQYMYSQDYVAKDAQGNGQIAVSGHSMGGFSSEMAIYLDEQNSRCRRLPHHQGRFEHGCRLLLDLLPEPGRRGCGCHLRRTHHRQDLRPVRRVLLCGRRASHEERHRLPQGLCCHHRWQDPAGAGSSAG